MPKRIIAALCAGLTAVSPLYVFALERKPVAISEKGIHQFYVDQALDKAFAHLEKVKSGAELANLAAKYLSVRDQKFARVNLANLKKLPKFKRLNRGFTYSLDGKHYSFVIEDIYSDKFVVNDKVSWRMSFDNPIEFQSQAIERALRNNSAAWHYLIPEAEAGWQIVITVGMMIMTVIFQDVLVPLGRELVCPHVDENIYRWKQFCNPYWKDIAESNKGTMKPPTTAPATAQNAVVAKPPKCYAINDPTFVDEFDLPGKEGGSVTIRRTINYKVDGETLKPQKMIHEVVTPATGEKTTYILDEKFQLLEVRGPNDLFLTRDPEKKEVMTQEKFLAEFPKYDTNVRKAQDATENCDPKTKAQLEEAAAQPGTAAHQILASDTDKVEANPKATGVK